jgi:two-component system NtrC family response regulator
MKAGAFDFIQKPIEKEHLLSVAQKAAEYITLKNENVLLKNLVEEHLDFGNMIGKSSAIQQVYHQARQVSSSSTTILIQGETGTGKEMLARAIHQNSPRKDKPFIAINCAAVPATLLESELFGHVKGAFTGAVSPRKGLIEEAGDGTFFLDEIGDLPLDLQPKLLRLLQEREFQPVGSNYKKLTLVRFIIATHHNLQEMVEANTFREDLYFRLNVVPLKLPRLCERAEDIIPLFQHFLREAAASENKEIPAIDKEVVSKLESYSWPGNVREVENLAQRLMALHTGERIEVADLPESFFVSGEETDMNHSLPERGFDLEEWTDKTILAALEKNNWNQSKTAQYLNISRNTLVYRMERRPLLKEAKQKNSTQ